MKFFKSMLFMGVLAAFLIVSGYNAAYATGCPPGQEKKGWKCVDIEDDDDDSRGSSSATIGDISNRNTNTNMNFIDVDNEIDMDQKQNQSQKQSQKQGQAQGQVAIAGAIQGQTAHNEGVKTNVTVEGDTITYKEQPNHINPVSGPDTDTATVRSMGHDAFVIGSIMDRVTGLPIEGIKMAAKDANDVRIQVAVFFEPEASVNYVRVGDDGSFAGYIYADCEDDQCSAAGMEAKAMEKAAELGFTHIIRVYESTGEKLYASEWSLKLGGGASVAADAGRMMIAPGGGIGGGSAESSTIVLPAMTFEVFYNPLFINVK